MGSSSVSTVGIHQRRNLVVMADGVRVVRCQNCHGEGFVHRYDHKYPCFVCDGDGSLVVALHTHEGADSG
jgi:DnaJ-class molecular chaperone